MNFGATHCVSPLILFLHADTHLREGLFIILLFYFILSYFISFYFILFHFISFYFILFHFIFFSFILFHFFFCILHFSLSFIIIIIILS